MTERNNKSKLIDYARDKGRLESIRDKLKTPSGGIASGDIPEEAWAIDILGETADKVILATDGIESIALNNITALGGWCSIRTHCLLLISDGILVDPFTGNKQKLSNIDQLRDWIDKSISADQIVEALGIYKGNNYSAISEISLWSQKLITASENALGRNLSKFEKDGILDSMIKAEDKRVQVTKNYIEYVKRRPIELKTITDIEIMPELIEGRNKLFTSIGLTIDELAEPMIKNRLKYVNFGQFNIKAISDLRKHVDSYSLVWFMYTQPYVDILRKHGLITTEYTIIMEPWSHANSNEAEALFNKRVFGDLNGKNNYLNEIGINSKLAFIGLDEVSYYSFKKSKVVDNISQVPNILNHKEYIERLYEDSNISNLNLSINPAFIHGFNYLPFCNNRDNLYKMIAIQSQYRKERIKLKKIGNRESFDSLRNDKSIEMKLLAEDVINELDKLFTYIFKI